MDLFAGTFLVLAAACGEWAWFLSGKTLDEADKWSSVMAGSAGAILGAGGLLALRQPPRTDQQASPPQPGSRNVEVGRDNHGTVISGDNNNVRQGSTTGKYHVNLQGAEGVQIGDDNTQINRW
jgi:hypothetical protein